jgi:hypothetical protein
VSAPLSDVAELFPEISLLTDAALEGQFANSATNRRFKRKAVIVSRLKRDLKRTDMKNPLETGTTAKDAPARSENVTVLSLVMTVDY